MILVSWLQTQTLAKCSSMRNPPAFGIANDDTQHVERIFSAFNIICVRFACIFSTIIPSHTLMDAALLQTLLQAFVHREKVQTVDAALEQDIQLMLQIFFGKIS